MKKTRAFFVVTALLSPVLGGFGHAESFSPLAPTANRIEPLEPIVLAKPVSKTSELTYAKRRKIEATQPKVKPIPQRVKMLNEHTMLLLPDENPLRHTGISAADLRETVNLGTTLQKPELPKVTPPKQATLKARITAQEDGKKILQLQGSSKGKHISFAKTGRIKGTEIQQPNIPKVTAVPPPETPKLKEAKTQQLKSIKLTYFADSIQPENLKEWERFVAQLSGKSVLNLRVVTQNPPQIFDALKALPQNRWTWLQSQLQAAGIATKGVTTSEVHLTHAGAGFLELITRVE